MPNGTYGGVRGGLNFTYSIDYCITKIEQREVALVTISRCFIMR